MDNAGGAPSAADEDAFWQLIEAARSAAGGDPAETAQRLGEILRGRSPEEIARFDAVFQAAMARSYTWDLWAAAYIVQGGCSDDCFEYFRGWLIGQGRETFEAVLRDPEELADLDAVFDESEEILYAARQAYEQRAGRELPWQRHQPAEPTGEPFDEASVNDRFPRLAAAFSM